MSNAELKLMLEQILSYSKENEWIEFKENNMGGEEVGERISALSNNACLYGQNYGYLVFGIEDETLNIVGTNKHFGEQRRGSEELEHWIVQRLNPRIDFRVYDFYERGKKISIIQIPAAVSQPVRFLHKSYIRIGSITRKLDEFPDKERKIWQSTPVEKFELKIGLSSVASKDLNGILSFETYFELLNVPIPTRLEAMIERFEEEKLIIKTGSRYNITNLGGILFAKDLMQFEDLNRKSVRIISYDGKNRLKTKKGSLTIFAN